VISPPGNPQGARDGLSSPSDGIRHESLARKGSFLFFPERLFSGFPFPSERKIVPRLSEIVKEPPPCFLVKERESLEGGFFLVPECCRGFLLGRFEIWHFPLV